MSTPQLEFWLSLLFLWSIFNAVAISTPLSQNGSVPMPMLSQSKLKTVGENVNGTQGVHFGLTTKTLKELQEPALMARTAKLNLSYDAIQDEKLHEPSYAFGDSKDNHMRWILLYVFVTSLGFIAGMTIVVMLIKMILLNMRTYCIHHNDHMIDIVEANKPQESATPTPSPLFNNDQVNCFRNWGFADDLENSMVGNNLQSSDEESDEWYSELFLDMPDGSPGTGRQDSRNQRRNQDGSISSSNMEKEETPALTLDNDGYFDSNWVLTDKFTRSQDQRQGANPRINTGLRSQSQRQAAKERTDFGRRSQMMRHASEGREVYGHRSRDQRHRVGEREVYSPRSQSQRNAPGERVVHGPRYQSQRQAAEERDDFGPRSQSQRQFAEERDDYGPRSESQRQSPAESEGYGSRSQSQRKMTEESEVYGPRYASQTQLAGEREVYYNRSQSQRQAAEKRAEYGLRSQSQRQRAEEREVYSRRSQSQRQTAEVREDYSSRFQNQRQTAEERETAPKSQGQRQLAEESDVYGSVSRSQKPAPEEREVYGSRSQSQRQMSEETEAYLARSQSQTQPAEEKEVYGNIPQSQRQEAEKREVYVPISQSQRREGEHRFYGPRHQRDTQTAEQMEIYGSRSQNQSPVFKHKDMYHQMSNTKKPYMRSASVQDSGSNSRGRPIFFLDMDLPRKINRQMSDNREYFKHDKLHRPGQMSRPRQSGSPFLRNGKIVDNDSNRVDAGGIVLDENWTFANNNMDADYHSRRQIRANLDNTPF